MLLVKFLRRRTLQSLALVAIAACSSQESGGEPVVDMGLDGSSVVDSSVVELDAGPEPDAAIDADSDGGVAPLTDAQVDAGPDANPDGGAEPPDEHCDDGLTFGRFRLGDEVQDVCYRLEEEQPEGGDSHWRCWSAALYPNALRCSSPFQQVDLPDPLNIIDYFCGLSSAADRRYDCSPVADGAWVPGMPPLPEADMERPKSICGVRPNWEDVEDSDGEGVFTRTWLDRFSRSVGVMHWDEIGQPGVTVSNRNWCTGTIVGPNLLLTAAHCLDPDDAQRSGWTLPDGANTPQAICDHTHFDFGYQRVAGQPHIRRQADLHAGRQSARCVQVVEFDRRLDVALLQLRGAEDVPPVELHADFQFGDDIALLQHPAGRPMVFDAGRISERSDATYLHHDCDTAGGSSGSAILDTAGRMIGVHTNGGCNQAGGTNRGTTIRAICENPRSDELRGLCNGQPAGPACHADPSSPWESLGEVPPRARATVVEAYPYVFFFFGHVGDDVVSTVAVYDRRRQGWFHIDGPVGFEGRVGMNATIVDQTVYLFGGSTRADIRMPSNTFLAFSIQALEDGVDPWVEVPQPEGIGAMATPVVRYDGWQDVLVVAFGRNEGGNVLDTSAVFDLRLRRWSVVPNAFDDVAPAPDLVGCSARAPGGVVVLGWTGDQPVVWQQRNRIWRLVCFGAACGPDAPPPSNAPGCAADRDAVYLVGGVRRGEQDSSDQAFRFDLAELSWSRLPAMPEGRREHGLGVIECPCADPDGATHYLVAAFGDNPNRPPIAGARILALNGEARARWRNLSGRDEPEPRETGGYFGTMLGSIVIASGVGDQVLTDSHILRVCSWPED